MWLPREKKLFVVPLLRSMLFADAANMRATLHALLRTVPRGSGATEPTSRGRPTPPVAIPSPGSSTFLSSKVVKQGRRSLPPRHPDQEFKTYVRSYALRPPLPAT